MKGPQELIVGYLCNFSVKPKLFQNENFIKNKNLQVLSVHILLLGHSLIGPNNEA